MKNKFKIGDKVKFLRTSEQEYNKLREEFKNRYNYHIGGWSFNEYFRNTEDYDKVYTIKLCIDYGFYKLDQLGNDFTEYQLVKVNDCLKNKIKKLKKLIKKEK